MVSGMWTHTLNSSPFSNAQLCILILGLALCREARQASWRQSCWDWRKDRRSLQRWVWHIRNTAK